VLKNFLLLLSVLEIVVLLTIFVEIVISTDSLINAKFKRTATCFYFMYLKFLEVLISSRHFLNGCESVFTFTEEYAVECVTNVKYRQP